MKIINLILDFIFPPICINCKKILNTFDDTRYICNDCLSEFTFNNVDGCSKCTRPLVNGLCQICSDNDDINFFNKNYSVFTYDNNPKVFIYKFKYGKDKRYSYLISKLMYEYIKENSLFDNIDIITDVPMYYKKEKERGFNQSILMCEQLSKYINKPYLPTLIRNKNTITQSSLSIKKRFENLNNVFDIHNKANVEGKNILIIDDIYTSGSTIIECSKILKQNGANEIYSLTFCIAHAK